MGIFNIAPFDNGGYVTRVACRREMWTHRNLKGEKREGGVINGLREYQIVNKHWGALLKNESVFIIGEIESE